MEEKRTLALTIVEKQYMDRILAEEGGQFKKRLFKKLIDYSSIEEIESILKSIKENYEKEDWGEYYT